jgi:pimeloyl-ACP methyl ester carboxylesterase
MRSPADRPPLDRRLRARIRALVLLAIVLELPLVARAVRRLTPEPETRELDVGGVPVALLHPPGAGPWPAWLFVNGAHPERRREPVVARLAEGLARAGYLVAMPDLPGLGDGRITTRTLDAAAAVTDATVRLPETRGGRVALIGASTGAGLALLVAARDVLADRISGVAAVAPFGDLERVVCLATTGCYVEGDAFARYEVTDLHRRVVAGSLVSLLPSGDDRERLLAELDRNPNGGDPLAALATVHGLAADARSVVRLLVNGDPERFRDLYTELPASLRSTLARLSPVAASGAVRAPVEVVVPPADVYFPLGEALAVADALPCARLTITRTLDHTRPQASFGRLQDFRRFGGFVVRGLANAG